MMPTKYDVHFIVLNKPQLKSHVAAYGKTLSKFINEAIREKIDRDLARAPPKVIVAGPIETEQIVPRKRGRPKSEAKSERLG